ncbi:MAG: hypothetical protein OES53_05500 [Xanthomonadales bacterium]|nr:hypothetical protein [Xanthomonadales bacterium]
MSGPTKKNIEIRAVTGKKALKTFIKVPWSIYRDDPHWIPPLLSERKDALSSKHPFFEHASWKAWVAWQDGKPVGRISAQVDQLHQERYQNKTGFFGLIEAPDDAAVFSALFGAAENWLRENGMQNVVGPFNLGINQEVGILVDGFDTPPRIMTTHSRRYYGPAIEQCGYTPAQDMLAYELDINTYRSPASKDEVLDRYQGRIKVRELNRKNMEVDFETMRDIFNDAWRDNWNSVPFSRAEFIAIGKELLMVVPHDFLQIAEIDGEPAGFIALLPDINEAIADLNGRLLPFGWAKLIWRLKVKFPSACRIPLMGVRKKYQNTIFGPAMAYMLVESVMGPGLGRGGKRVEMSWILESNKPTRNIIEKFGGKITKRYRMYEKTLT